MKVIIFCNSLTEASVSIHNKLENPFLQKSFVTSVIISKYCGYFKSLYSMEYKELLCITKTYRKRMKGDKLGLMQIVNLY